MKVKVLVEKRLLCTGMVEVECDDTEFAEEKVDELIESNTLQADTVEWSTPTYEEGSFQASPAFLDVSSIF